MKNIFRTYHKFKIRIETKDDGSQLFTALLITGFTPLYLFKTTKAISIFGNIYKKNDSRAKNGTIESAYEAIESFKYLLQKRENRKTTSITYIDYQPENNK
jgi:hypothetical protein